MRPGIGSEKNATTDHCFPQPRRLGLLLSVLLVAVGASLNLRNIIINDPDLPAYTGRLFVDSGNYHEGAVKMLSKGDVLYTADTFHSAGMQVLVASLYRLFGEHPLAVKLFNFLCWSASLLFCYRLILSVYRSRSVAQIGTALFSTFNILHKYSATMQYEIFALLLILIVVDLNDMAAQPSTLKLIATAVVVSILTFVRGHFALLFPLYLVAQHWQTGLDWKHAAVPSTVLMGILAALVAIYSAHRGKLSSFSILGGRVARYLNENSVGYSYPYPEMTKPNGLDFVISRPGKYLSFLCTKTLYLFGIKPDIWYIEPYPVQGLLALTGLAKNRLIAVHGGLSLIFSHVGLFLFVWRSGREHLGKIFSLLVPLVPIFISQLIIGSSTRFLVPVLPVLFVLQLRCFTRGNNRWIGRRTPGRASAR